MKRNPSVIEEKVRQAARLSYSPLAYGITDKTMRLFGRKNEQAPPLINTAIDRGVRQCAKDRELF